MHPVFSSPLKKDSFSSTPGRALRADQAPPWAAVSMPGPWGPDADSVLVSENLHFRWLWLQPGPGGLMPGVRCPPRGPFPAQATPASMALG